jgi:enoyl-CoA hydratase/carnithine racemase
MIETETRGGVIIIRVANPPRHYMTAETAAELDAAVAAALADDASRVIVLTGGGEGVFIRHYSIPEIEAMADALEAGAISAPLPRADVPVYRLIDRLRDSPKPVIAAINGTCMGGGFETALACTLRVAVDGDYPIGLPETRLGILPGAGGLQFLARLMGLSQATAFVLQGAVVPPAEALRLGLVHRLAATSALEAALELAEQVAARPPAALREVLAMSRAIAAGESLGDGLETAARAFLATLAPDSGARARLARFHEVGEDILA